MSAKFYDKYDIEIDKRVQDLNERLAAIRRAYPNEVEYIRQGRKVFNYYDDKVRERVVDLLIQESKWTKAATIFGATVGALAIWELFQGVKMALRWVGDKIAQSDNIELSRSRTHARNWNNN